MSKSEILYVKDMNLSDTDQDENDEDIWDDKKLKDAYDKAVKIANVEVARRVAMSTNTQQGKKEDVDKNKKEKPQKSLSTAKKRTWKAGAPCRAQYDGDGFDYEAFIVRIINDEECVVKFLGYDNTEIVPISSLKPTLGNDERVRQIEQFFREKMDDGFASQSPNLDAMELSSDVMQSTGSTERQRKKKKSTKKKSHSRSFNGMEMPDMPFPMPNISLMKNFGSMDMPIPPPPPMNFSRTDSEDQALSSMLLSWYMSGYYTGLYQGMKRAKESRRND